MDLPDNAFCPLFVHPWMKWGPLETYWRANSASAVWPAANRAIYIPISIALRYPVKRVFVSNGAAVSGNFDLGVYSFSGAKKFSTGSVAQAGIGVPQYVAADFILNPGLYYFALVFDNITAQVQRSAPTSADVRLAGFLQEATAFTLPNAMTPAAFASAYCPLMGVTLTDTGF